MASSTMTIAGLQAYLQPDDDIFTLLKVPPDIDRDLLIDNILVRSSSFEVLYSDPRYMQNAIRVWSMTHYWTFDKWVRAINISYDPLENYDRREEWTDTSKDSGTATSATNNDSTDTSTDKTTNDLTNSGTTTTDKSAFDDNDYSPYDKVTVNSTSGNNVDSTHTNTLQGNTTNTSSANNESETKRSGRTHGNIGVTTSQQMLQSELDIAKFNLINQITDLFIKDFCVMTY